MAHITDPPTSSGIQLSWHDEAHSILRADFELDWDWLELVETYDRIIALIHAVAPRRVDLILFNRSKGFRLPVGNPWPAVRRLAASIPSNAGIQIQVGGTRESIIFQNMQRHFSTDAAARTYFADTLEEAITLIDAARAGMLDPAPLMD
jgi:hypothetical protein